MLPLGIPVSKTGVILYFNSQLYCCRNSDSNFTDCSNLITDGIIPKIGSELEVKLLNKISIFKCKFIIFHIS